MLSNCTLIEIRVKKDARNMSKEDLAKHYPVKAPLTPIRIYDFNPIEDILFLSSRREVLDAHCLNYDELCVGEVIRAQVVSINSENGGIYVKLSEFVRGFVPRIHTGDVPLSEKMLAKRMKPGSEVKARVLSVDAAEKRCILTMKKSLVRSKLPLICDYDRIERGMQTYGVVISIKDYGLLLGFFNDLKGLLPRDQISRTMPKTQSLTELYSLGQLIKCRVMNLDKDKGLIKLSLLMDDGLFFKN